MTMKFKNIYILTLCLATFLAACKKEEQPVSSEHLNIPQMFGPAADADPQVKSLFNQYGLWIRMDFKDVKEVTNAILYSDVNNRFGATKIDNDKRAEAITFTQSLLSNVSDKFSKSFFPLEFFYVKTYNGSWWATDLQTIGRSRIVITWPNKMIGALPVVDPATHYYRDSVLTRAIWSSLGTTITPKMTVPVEGFELAGKAYDNGLAVDRITDDYYKDYDLQKRDAAYTELANSGGFITGQGSRSFDSDFPQWLVLLTTESYRNIKKNYLDNSPRRAKKYEILIKYFNSYGWDIQAAGNLYRQKLDLYK
jgi:hypothetical protein